MQRAELVLDDPLAEILVGQRLGAGAARIGRRLERREHLLVEEVGERAVADVMEQPGHPQGLDDQALGRDRLPRLGDRERGTQARVERARPQARLVHDARGRG